MSRDPSRSNALPAGPPRPRSGAARQGRVGDYRRHSRGKPPQLLGGRVEPALPDLARCRERVEAGGKQLARNEDDGLRIGGGGQCAYKVGEVAGSALVEEQSLHGATDRAAPVVEGG